MKKRKVASKQFRELPWYTEGPSRDSSGAFFFTTLNGGAIMRIGANDDEAAEWGKGIRPNGQVILPNGHHLVCDAGNASISRYDISGNLLGYDVKDHCAGEKISAPNDIIADSSGGIYFTDSVRHHGYVYYYSSDGVQKVVARNMDFPNGIALSKDERTLFIAESYKNRILCLSLLGPGAGAGECEVFANLPENTRQPGFNFPDGIKIAGDDTLWVAHYGMQVIQVLDRNGDCIDSLPVDFPRPSNLFIDGDHVFVTGGFDEPGPGGFVLMKLF